MPTSHIRAVLRTLRAFARVRHVLLLVLTMSFVLLAAPHQAAADVILDTTGCPTPMTSVLSPGTEASTADCNVTFGSNTGVATLRMYQVDGVGTAMGGISDFVAGTSDWATAGTNLFGACLRAKGATGVVESWTVDAGNDCVMANTDAWRRIVPTSGDAGSVVADTTGAGVIDASVSVRFGMRFPASQAPGIYSADLVIEAIAPAVPSAPVNTAPPTFSPTTGLRVGAVVTKTSDGTWTNSPTGYSQQWLRCNSAGSSCVAIAGATAVSYTTTIADLYRTLRLQVTAVNAGGATSADSIASSPVMNVLPTYTFLTGFEHGTVSSAGGGLYQSLPGGAAPTVVGAAARNGVSGLRCNAGASSCLGQWAGPGTSTGVARTSVLVQTAPTAPTGLMELAMSSGTRCARIGWAGGAFQASFVTSCGGAESMVASQAGPAITTGRWYTIDMRATSSGATWTLDWQVDGMAQTPVTWGAGAGETAASTRVGTTNGSGGDLYVDDVAVSGTSGDFPIGFGRDLGHAPATRGTHVLPASFNAFVGPGGTTQNILANPETLTPFSETGIDEWPIDTTDGVQQQSDTSGTAFAEHRVTAAAGDPQGIRTMFAVRNHASGGAGSTFATKINDGGADVTIGSAAGYTGTGISYWGATQARTPTGSTPWTQASLNAFRLRFGYGSAGISAARGPRVDAELVEADYPLPPPTPPANTVLPSISGTATETLVLTSITGTWINEPVVFAWQWRRCDSAGTNCVDIAGATSTTYTLVVADIGSTIRIVERATNAGGTTDAESAATTIVSGRIPANTVVPTFAGGTEPGLIVNRTSDGTWNGTAAITYGYQWQRCTSPSDTTTCANIAGATASSYTLTMSDDARYIRLGVIATNVCAVGCGSTTAHTAIGPFIGFAPASTAVPTISGTTTQGQGMSSTTGTWTGTTPITYAYQWQRCTSNVDLTTCANIGGATGAGYLLVNADVGNYVRAQVTATNGAGAASAFSVVSARVVGLPPADSVLPGLGGSLVDLQVISTTNGTWSGTTPFSYGYQWQRCTSNVDLTTCANIVGATASTYSLVTADVGNYARVIVTATNVCWSGCASTAATSIVSARIAGAAPVNTAVPTTAGTTTQAQVMSGFDGTWTGTTLLSYAYQWQRCTSNVDLTTCANILGATTTLYTLQNADVGNYVRIAVTASNVCWSGCGSTTANSPVSARVAGLPPVNTALPTISGTTNDGEPMTSTNGAWSGTTPISYTYQWQRCTSNVDLTTCANIGAATAAGYTLQGADVGNYVRIGVIGTNTCWSGCAAVTAYSAVSTRVTGDVASNTSPPTASGTAMQEEALAATTGAWAGTSAIAFTYQWQRCTSSTDMTTCTNTPGATAATYVLVAGDVGLWVRVGVTGSNSCWSGCGGETSYSAVGAQIVEVQVPVGTIVAYGGSTLPAGWLWADGAAVNRATYAELFTTAGTTYGAGDGSTTFNVPNLRQAFPLGKATAGTGSTLGSSGGSIDHTHAIASHAHSIATDAAHTHTVSAHSHTTPGHSHTDNLTTGSAGAHSHALQTGNNFWVQGGSGTVAAYRATGAEPVSAQSFTAGDGAHSHSLTGTIGLTTGTNGDIAGTTGATAPAATATAGHSHGGATGTAAPTTTVNNPPFQVVEYIVKATTTATNPCGLVWGTGRSSASTGAVIADGAALSRTTDATLFGCLGTAYGPGDGSTTFNVPDLRQRFPLGRASAGTGSTRGATGGAIDHSHSASHAHSISTDGAHTASVPAHTHTVSGHDHSFSLTASSTGNHNHGPSNGGLFVSDTDGGYTKGPGTRNYSLSAGGFTSYDGAHTHSVAGTVGLGTGANGNATMTATAPAIGSTSAGGHDHGATTATDAATTTANNPPFQSLNFEVQRAAGTEPGIGAVSPFAGTATPNGWTLADGRALSRTTHSELFALIGTTYGAGDGSSTFNVPDLRQRFPLGRSLAGTGATLGSTGGAIDHTHASTHAHSITTEAAHSHSVNSHTASIPGHYHADTLTTASGGNHRHGNSIGGNWWGQTASMTWAECGCTLRPMIAVTRTDTQAAHTHTVTGTIGAGPSGNAALASGATAPGTDSLGAHNHGGASSASPSTTSTNPPFLTVNFIIKVKGLA